MTTHEARRKPTRATLAVLATLTACVNHTPRDGGNTRSREDANVAIAASGDADARAGDHRLAPGDMHAARADAAGGGADGGDTSNGDAANGASDANGAGARAGDSAAAAGRGGDAQAGAGASSAGGVFAGMHAAGAAASTAAARGARAFDCSRPGLEALVAAYLEALTARDPTRLPISPSLKFTENGQRVQLGEGLWKTAGSLAAQRSALDTENCGTATQASLRKADGATLIGVRLELDAGAISEIETYVVELGSAPQSLMDANVDEWTRALPADRRNTRQELLAIADAFFDNLGDPAKPAPFGTPCDQAANGLGTAQIATQPGHHTCGSVPLPVIPGLPNINATPTHRRFPIADVETGITVALGLVVESRINFTLLKVIDGKIRFVESVVGPDVSSPGWDAP